MALLNILTYPNPVLRQTCKQVDRITPEMVALLENMAETMYEAPGIGLAAPQIGILQRIIVVDVLAGTDDHDPRKSLFQLINPVITQRSGTTTGKEGCLSLPGFETQVRRAAEITVEALDPDGNELEITCDGMLAICLQHEIDHLDGVLILDKASPLKRRSYLQRLKKEQASNMLE